MASANMHVSGLGSILVNGCVAAEKTDEEDVVTVSDLVEKPPVS